MKRLLLTALGLATALTFAVPTFQVSAADAATTTQTTAPVNKVTKSQVKKHKKAHAMKKSKHHAHVATKNMAKKKKKV
jgi:hypothetical protein